MTIQKKISRKPPAYHRKVNGAHHRRSKRYHETYWPYIPLVLVVVIGLLANVFLNARPGVLGYATDMSIQSLLDDTNTQRTSNGITGLTLNGLLNNAAQAKANDMSARDYWSHNTPDGQTPWTFITAAGYNYRLAGENLAYGFSTAADTLTGWMNSPGHRANILNSGYTEVGFGFVDIANYQNNGPETLVVAMYGAPQTVVAATPAAAAAPKPLAASAPASSNGSSASAASGGSQAKSPTDVSAQPTANPTSDQTPQTIASQPAIVVPTETAKNAIVESKPQHIARVQLLTAGNASWSIVATSLIGVACLGFFLLRHGIAWHKIWVKGERYLLRHPLLDVGLVGLIALAFILTRTAGHTR